MTGSLQIKNNKYNKYYIVLNTYENGKRKIKWINTDLPVKGNKTRAQKLLREALEEYEQAEELRAQQEADRANLPYDSGSEFSARINGRKQAEIWPIIEELVDSVQLISPRLYNSFFDRLV